VSDVLLSGGRFDGRIAEAPDDAEEIAFKLASSDGPGSVYVKYRRDPVESKRFNHIGGSVPYSADH
jgi:hypothetical protein